jgi:hypothetical protein
MLVSKRERIVISETMILPMKKYNYGGFNEKRMWKRCTLKVEPDDFMQG